VSLTSHQRPVQGATNEWLTPPEIIEALGPFDLDPCAPRWRPWPTAAQHYTIEEDGLTQPWHGFVWCNPPFGPHAGVWLARLAEHGHGIGLCPARTETRWFVATVWQAATAVLFLHGRPHFHHSDGTRGRANSGAPICLVAYGTTALQRLQNAGLAGTLVALRAAGGAPEATT
jgi:hypothetical protein